MKKYLSIAAVLGVIAFLSVSFLAQAEPEMKAAESVVMEKAVEPAADAAVVAVPAPDAAAEATKKECEDTVNASKKADGTEWSTEEKTAAVTKCVADKAAAHVEDKAQAVEGAVEVAPEKAAE